MTRAECAAWLRERDGFLILTHCRPDGDALGSAAALCRGLRSLGKQAFVLENPEANRRYAPLLLPYLGAAAGLIPISVDLADEGILQRNGDPYRGQIALSIDHHPSNSGYAAQRLLEAERASCGEIVYGLLRELGAALDRETATLLYIAVTTDTGCFRYKNTTPDTLRVGAALLELGAPIDLNRTLFMKKRPSRLKLESVMIESLDFFQNGEACIATVTLADLERCAVTEEDLEDIAAVSGQVEGVETSITVRQSGEKRWKISVRTGEYGNANAICAEFGGGGHGMASGCTLEGALEEVKARLKDAVCRHWHEAPV